MSVEPPSPAANPYLFGHERAEAVLIRAFQNGRLPHAWLFKGPHGVGKATLAFRFARRLLAGPAGHEAAARDPAHPVFRMVASGAHPDLRVVKRIPNPKTGKLYKEILVEQVRDADAALHATAARAGQKVLVVDPADELNDSAANALLKLLEEPPAGVILLLVCQRPGLLPRTILSRCAQITLAPLPEPQLLAGVAALAPDLAPERVELLAQLARGSIGRALELGSSGWLERYAELVQKLSVARDSEVARLVIATQLLQGGEGTSFRGAVDLLGLVLRRLARLAAGEQPLGRELFSGETAILEELAAGRGLDRWVGLWDKLSALALRVETLNLDPLVALLQIVQAACGAEPEIELGLA